MVAEGRPAQRQERAGAGGDAAAASHLVHGMGTALERPTWPAITACEAETILAYFPDAGRFDTLCWHSPRPFSAAALVQAEDAEYVLKRHHRRLRSPAALGEEHAFMSHLRSGGIAVPEVMTTHGGAGAVAHGGWTYELHRKAEGLDLYRERTSWTPFLRGEHAFAAGATLARLHVAARGFSASARSPAPLIGSSTIIASGDPVSAATSYIEARPALARFLTGKPWRKELHRLIERFGAGLEARLQVQPSLWTHNDWHPSNLLWSADDEVSTVFDFGLAAPTCALHDLATAIERTAIPWLEIAERGPDVATDTRAALLILDGYRTVLPLSPADIATIAQLLPLAHIEFALSEVHYFADILDDATQADLAWQGYAIDHADWFQSSCGEALLQQIRQAV